MKNVRLISSIIALLFFFPASRLVANSLFMGRVVSVHAYGALDTVRNPALLSYQRMDNSLGLVANYQTFIDSNIIMKHTKPALVKLKTDYFDSGWGHLSYARKIDSFSLGIDLYSSYESSNVKIKSLAISTILMPGEGSSKKNTMSQAITASLAYEISSNHSIGLLLNVSYLDSTQTDKSRSIQPTFPPVYFHNLDKDMITEISSSPRIGYLARISHSEIGIMFSPGRLAWKKVTKKGESYDISPLLAQLYFKAQDTLPYTFKFDMGPVLTAGAYSRPVSDIAMAIELELTMPVTFRQPFLMRVDTLFDPLSRIRYFKNTQLGIQNDVSTRPYVSIRGGFEFYASRTTVFSLGAGLIYTDTKVRIHGFFPSPFQTTYIYNFMHAIYGMTGLDFLVGKENVITIGMTVSSYRMTEEETFKSIFDTWGRELHNSNFKLRTINADVTVASSFGF